MARRRGRYRVQRSEGPVGPGLEDQDAIRFRAHEQVGTPVSVAVAAGEGAGARLRRQGQVGDGQFCRIARLSGPEDTDPVTGQNGQVGRAVAIEVGGCEIERARHPEVARAAEKKAAFGTPEDAYDRAGGLTRNPRLAVQHRDVAPPVAIQVDNGQCAGVVHRKQPIASARNPPLRAAPQDGQEAPRILETAVVGAEYRVQAPVAVEVVDDDPEAPFDR